MKASLQAKMSQSMTLTPQLLQSIRLLQLTSLQLEQELQLVLERNPLLEQDPSDDEDNLPAGDADTPALENAAWDELPDPMFLSGGGHAADPDQDATARIVESESSDPRQRLLQLLQLRCTARELAIAAYWLDCCDDNGYLEDDPDLLARHGEAAFAELQPHCSRAELLTVRKQFLLHGEWPGMSACDPGECLLAQLQVLPDSDQRTLAMRIARDHLPLLASHDYPALAACTGASTGAVTGAVSLLLSLQPHPVEQPPPSNFDIITPDVLTWRAAGGWQVQLNDRGIPKLRLCAYAEQAASGHETMRGLLDEARWMLRSIGMRNETLLKTAQVLVARQQAFLEQGEEAIAPLTLKEVAEAIGMHESTVSRITTGKYIQTPRGTFELKQLFAVRLDGADVSGAAIKAMVRRLIENEPAHAPLADDAIAAMLARQNVRIARRTVAKYREQMGIAPARQRRSDRNRRGGTPRTAGTRDTASATMSLSGR